MNRRKAMSQTLALIVAASVLMMTALTVIFLARGSLSELGQTSGRQSCINAIESQCQATSAVSIDMPGVCQTKDAQGETRVRQDVMDYLGTEGGYSLGPGGETADTVNCPAGP